MRKITHKSANNQALLELFQFSDVKKLVEVSFTAPDISSLGGFHILHALNMKQGFLSRLCSCIHEWRNELLVVHGIEELLTQRVFQIAAGYEDADDCDTLRNDNMLKLCCGRMPSECDLASQPTMTRLENHVSHRELYKMGQEFVHQFIRSYKKEPKELYEKWYCKRGDCELYIKELKNGLRADRMSCSRFSANQFRLFLYAAAYVLLLEAKQILFRKTGLENVTIITFRERVIFSAVRITELKTKIKIEFTSTHPIRDKMRCALRKSA